MGISYRQPVGKKMLVGEGSGGEKEKLMGRNLPRNVSQVTISCTWDLEVISLHPEGIVIVVI